MPVLSTKSTSAEQFELTRLKKMSLIGLLWLIHTFVFAQTSFQTNTTEGYWNVASAKQALPRILTRLNGQNVLTHAQATQDQFQTTIDGLTVTVRLSVKEDKWVQLAVSVYNPTSDTLLITSFEPLVTDCSQALTHTLASDLKVMWESATYAVGRATDHESHYYAALYSDKSRMGPAWMIAYYPPQLWTSMVKKEGSSLAAYVNFRGRKFPVNPGETITFDPLLVSAAYNAMEGWQAIGKWYTPVRLASEAVHHSGFNTWDFFRGEISTKELAPVLHSLTQWNKGYEAKLRYFVLDDGWFPERGTWEFDPKKFPEGEKGWAQLVHQAGMEPGVWIAPFWSNKQKIAEYQMTVQQEVPDHVIRYRVDPSDPNVRRYVIDRFRALRKSGYTYFKIDFLELAYTDIPYKYSKFHPERVIRDFLLEVREAIGKDAFLLGCSTVVPSCAMVCDGARIMSDITENWTVTKDIYLRIAYRYWMSGNLFLADPDFFVGRGPQTLNEGAFPGYALETGDRQYEGFTYTQAKTWAAMGFVIGGHTVWGDHPQGVKKEISDLLGILAQYGPGKPGIPLDLMDTEQPTKWIRTHQGKKYLTLINVEDKPVTITVSVKEVPELAQKLLLKDIFTHVPLQHQGGTLKITLLPFDSSCLALP
jgi:hypothetical protein